MSFTGYAPGWQLRCRKCGYVQDAASAGIVRVGAWGRKYILRRCSHCNRVSFLVLEKTDAAVNQLTKRRLVQILVPIILFILLFPPALVFSIRYGLSKAQVYQTAIQRINDHPEIIRLLGPPLHYKMWNGNIRNGHADIRFNVIGDSLRARCNIRADKQNGYWQYMKLELVTDNGRQFDLRKE